MYYGNVSECVCVCVCGYVLMYVLHASVLVYCPTYCGRCLMRGRGMLNQWPAPDPMD